MTPVRPQTCLSTSPPQGAAGTNVGCDNDLQKATVDANDDELPEDALMLHKNFSFVQQPQVSKNVTKDAS